MTRNYDRAAQGSETTPNHHGTCLALNADGLKVEQSVFCRNRFRMEGQISLTGAHIEGQLNLNGGTLVHTGGRVLTGDGLTVEQDMFCQNGFSAQGQVRLCGAHIKGQLGFNNATLSSQNGTALSLEGLHAGELWLRPRIAPDSAVNLTRAKVGAFYDSQCTWPQHLYLDGFVYDRLYGDPEVSVKGRLDWLERDPSGYVPHPYEQLATAYRQAGREDDARKVAIARQLRRRQALNWPGKIWNTLLRWTVGYGYQIWRAGVWLVVLIGLGWFIFDLAHPAQLVAAKPPGQRPWFHAGPYALDLLLPFADLGYQGAWIASGWTRWFYLGWNLAGWVLITTVVAALSSLIKRD
jgi:hypothetical protein